MCLRIFIDRTASSVIKADTAHLMPLKFYVLLNESVMIIPVFLYASAAFDRISWSRNQSQRNVPVCLIKIIMVQLFGSKISIYGTAVLFHRNGIKQGGVLSGWIFSACYDDLVDVIYADDVVLIASSPRGLKLLIDATFLVAAQFNDISFNPSKSRIVRLGLSKKPPVSVCNIPTATTNEYLGVDIGSAAYPEAAAISKLYCT